MNRAQRRQAARSTRKARKDGLAPALPGMTPDVMRDMETAVRRHRAGDLIGATELYQSVLDRCPDQPDALNFLGVIAGEMGQYETALRLIDRSLALDGTNAVYHNNRGNVLRRRGMTDEAVAAYRRAVGLAPDYAAAHNNLGTTLGGIGRTEEAEACFRHAVAADPANADALGNLGTCLYVQARFEDSAAAYRRAIAAAPAQPAPRTNLANALAMLGRTAEAEAACRAALAIDADHGHTHLVLGGLLEAQGRFAEAEEALRDALRARPDAADAWNNLGNLMRTTGRVPEAIQAFARAVALDPANALAHSNLIFSLGLDPATGADALLAEARLWNDRHAAPLAAKARPHRNARDPDRRLRVGYVSPDFRQHAVGHFLTPLFDAQDREAVEIFAYADVARPDARTAWFATRADRWRATFGWSDARLAGQVRDDRIDILIDVAGHTGGNRLPAFAERPAPVQASWLGYGGTTGMDAMGWRITDARTDPPGAEAQYCERLVRLPHSLFCYTPDPDAPPVAPPPHAAGGAVTFGSLNNPSKITERAVACWAEVLARVPGARMVLKGRGLDDGAMRERFLAAFARHGVAAHRLELIGYQEAKAGHLAVFGRVDAVLDTFPYSGATTTCEALWMGVPVITVAGDRYVARMAAGILGCAGLDELVAADEADYVDRAVALAGDLPRLAALRATLRDRIAGSPLCGARAFARAMERAYRDMWRAWCSGGHADG